MRPERRRLAIGAALVVLAAGALGKLAPAVWAAWDVPLVIALAARDETGDLRPDARDAWGRPLSTRTVRPRTPGGIVHLWRYSVGPDGVDDLGEGDDVPLLAWSDPRLRLYREAEPLAALAGFGLGAWLLLLLQRRPLRGLGRAALPVLGALATGALAFPALRALELLEPTALPPWPLAAQLLTALLGGAIVGLALTPVPDEATLMRPAEQSRDAELPPPRSGARS